LPLFFYLSDSPQEAKFSLLAVFAFRWYSHIGESENERQRAKNQATEGNGNEGTQRNTAHGSKFRLFSAFSRLGGTLGRVERLKRITSDF
jgi:hypothetical protein